MSDLRIVFLGTPELACPFLTGMVDAGHKVVGVISQPDRKKGRGMKLCCPPVKDNACALALEVFQPQTGAELVSILTELKPDLGVVVAYGRLLKKEALAVPKLGFINVHFSLLPRYRGAAPVQRALIAGETKTGVTVFWLDEGMDTGPVQAMAEVPIAEDDYAPELFTKTSAVGRELLNTVLQQISAGEIIKQAQSGVPSLAPMLAKQETLLNFNGPARIALNLVRGLACGPKARFEVRLQDAVLNVQVLHCSLPSTRRCDKGAEPGSVTMIESGKGFYIQCSDGELLIEEVKPEGKNAMKAVDFLNGARLKPGDKLL